MEASNDNALTPSLAERIEGAIERAKEKMPSLTTGLVLAAMLSGATLGAIASKPLHRWQINREIRDKLAIKSDAVRNLVKEGVDDEAIIATLGDADAKLAEAEQKLARLKWAPSPAQPGECRIPAWRVR